MTEKAVQSWKWLSEFLMIVGPLVACVWVVVEAAAARDLLGGGHFDRLLVPALAGVGAHTMARSLIGLVVGLILKATKK